MKTYLTADQLNKVEEACYAYLRSNPSESPLTPLAQLCWTACRDLRYVHEELLCVVEHLESIARDTRRDIANMSYVGSSYPDTLHKYVRLAAQCDSQCKFICNVAQKLKILPAE